MPRIDLMGRFVGVHDGRHTCCLTPATLHLIDTFRSHRHVQIKLLGHEPSATPLRSLDLGNDVLPADARRMTLATDLTTEHAAESFGRVGYIQRVGAGATVETLLWR